MKNLISSETNRVNGGIYGRYQCVCANGESTYINAHNPQKHRKFILGSTSPEYIRDQSEYFIDLIALAIPVCERIDAFDLCYAFCKNNGGINDMISVTII